MLCITSNSMAPAGRSSQLGEGIYSHPESKPCASILSGPVNSMLFRIICSMRIPDAESLHAVAHGSEGQSQQFGGCRAIEPGLLQRFQQGLLLDMIQIFRQRVFAAEGSILGLFMLNGHQQ